MSNTQNIINVPNESTNNNEENDPIFYKPTDIARLLDCSLPTTYNIMHREDFPLINVGNHLRVYKVAFEKWAMERRG